MMKSNANPVAGCELPPKASGMSTSTAATNAKIPFSSNSSKVSDFTSRTHYELAVGQSCSNGISQYAGPFCHNIGKLLSLSLLCHIVTTRESGTVNSYSISD